VTQDPHLTLLRSPNAGGALQDHIDAQAGKIGARFKARAKLCTFDGICRMAGEGVGIGIVPETAARRCRRSAQTAVIRLFDDWATRRLLVCIRSERELTPPTSPARRIWPLVEETMTGFGRLDTAFNNAGFQERRAPLATQTDAMRHEIPALIASGGGRIVNNASVSGVRNPNPGLSLCGASKAAAIALTRAAAMEYAPQGVRINAVAPDVLFENATFDTCKGAAMRVPLIPFAGPPAEQRRLCDDMKKGIETNFKGLTAVAGA
jgi:NAD(P)-dependent dehydrogenase (short-subunit alcohol dehydrogenase family)